MGEKKKSWSLQGESVHFWKQLYFFSLSQNKWCLFSFWSFAINSTMPIWESTGKGIEKKKKRSETPCLLHVAPPPFSFFSLPLIAGVQRHRRRSREYNSSRTLSQLHKSLKKKNSSFSPDPLGSPLMQQHTSFAMMNYLSCAVFFFPPSFDYYPVSN